MKYWLILWVVIVLGSCEDKLGQIQQDLPDDFMFTYLPTDLSQMEVFGAIGQIFGIPKAHGGFRYPPAYTDPSIPVVAMSDGVIYNIRFELNDYTGATIPAHLIGKSYEDYAIEIALSKTATMHFGHISKLSPSVLEEAGKLKFGRGVANKVNIKIQAGQILGYIGIQGGFDIGVYETKDLPYFANPKRYSSDYKGARPFTDFLPASLRDKVWAINPRTVEPRGGKVAYDVAGTVAGNWFLEGTRELTEWSKQLIFARHELYADRISILDASPLHDGDGKLNNGVEANHWWVVGNTPLPESITMSFGKIKYPVAPWYRLLDVPGVQPSGTVLIELVSDTKLKFEYFANKLPDEIAAFSGAAKMYER